MSGVFTGADSLHLHVCRVHRPDILKIRSNCLKGEDVC